LKIERKIAFLNFAAARSASNISCHHHLLARFELDFPLFSLDNQEDVRPSIPPSYGDRPPEALQKR
jgi:hypothetical protein